MNATQNKGMRPWSIEWVQYILGTRTPEGAEYVFKMAVQSEVNEALAAAKEDQKRPPTWLGHCSGCTDPHSEETHQMGTIEHPDPPAKEEQGKVLTDEEIERRAYGRTDDPVMAAGYMMAIRDMQDNGYIAPANGLDVEGVMSLVNEHLFGINTSTNDDVVCSVMGQDALRKALEAYAENRSGNLRSNPLTPNSVVDQKGDDVNS